MIAVCETVRDYGVYDNAGENAGLLFNKEDYKHSNLGSFKSKYYKTWDQYKIQNPETPESAKPTVMSYEDS